MRRTCAARANALLAGGKTDQDARASALRISWPRTTADRAARLDDYAKAFLTKGGDLLAISPRQVVKVLPDAVKILQREAERVLN